MWKYLLWANGQTIWFCIQYCCKIRTSTWWWSFGSSFPCHPFPNDQYTLDRFSPSSGSWQNGRFFVQTFYYLKKNVILGNFYNFKLLTFYSKGSDSTEDFRVPKITEEDYCCHTRFFFQDDARLKLWWSFVASSKIPPKNKKKKNRNFWDCFFGGTRTPSFRGR